MDSKKGLAYFLLGAGVVLANGCGSLVPEPFIHNDPYEPVWEKKFRSFLKTGEIYREVESDYSR